MMTKALFEFLFKNYFEYDYSINNNELAVYHEDGHKTLFSLKDGIPFSGSVVVARQDFSLEGEVFVINNCHIIFKGTSYVSEDGREVLFHAYSSTK